MAEDKFPQIELRYAKPIHWYQRKWMLRLVISLAVLWTGWTLFQRARPYWYRLICYRVEQVALKHVAPTDRVAFRYSATQPYVASAISSDPIYARLWGARSDAQAIMQGQSNLILTHTPIFIGCTRNTAGEQNVNEIFADVEPATAATYDWVIMPRGPIPASGLAVVSFRLHCWTPSSWKWVFDLNNGSQSYDLSLVQFVLLPSDTLVVKEAHFDPSHNSVVELPIILNNKPTELRFDFADGPCPVIDADGLAAANRRISGGGWRRGGKLR